MADVLNGFGPAVLLSLPLWHLLAIRRIPLQNRVLRAESQIALRPRAESDTWATLVSVTGFLHEGSCCKTGG